MNKRKKTIKKICESTYYGFLNDYHFNTKMKKAFDEYFEKELIKENENKFQFWIAHRNFFFVLAYKNGYSTTFIAPIYEKKHCSVIHNIRMLTDRMDFKDKISLTAKDNVKKFLELYSKMIIEANPVIKIDYSKRESARDLIDSFKVFDFFDEFEFDLEQLILFKSKFGVQFVTRKEPDIFYRNFLIIALSKKYKKLKTVGTLFDINHATVINAIQRTCVFVNNNDKEIIEIFEKVKFFFNRYCERKPLIKPLNHSTQLL